ncbi:MAG: AraC family transcriptional regulator [Bacteroidales bacterium]|jgi:AraC-like DNA-binding protein|nr:AraC family transcriptional regulator [Bacteroidales bacterium]
MVAELEKISYDDGVGFVADYIDDTGGLWHFHPEYELVLNIKSNGTRIIGDSVELFDMNDMVLIAGNIPHSWNYYKSDKSLPEKHGIMVHFRQASLGDALLAQHEMHCVRDLLEQSDRGIGFSVEDAKKAEKHLVQMINNKGIDKMIDFFNVLRILCQAEKKVYLCSENYKQVYDERGNKKMADVYTYIRENYFKPISLEKISKIAKMSPFSFSRFFKKNCGAGFVEYLNRVRTNKACYLLRETDYQVHDISIECGFASISNFNKQFRKTEGISPRDYRAQFK